MDFGADGRMQDFCNSKTIFYLVWTPLIMLGKMNAGNAVEEALS
jgi:hypothetical protein